MTSSHEGQVSGFFVEVRSILCAESVDFIGSRKSEKRLLKGAVKVYKAKGKYYTNSTSSLIGVKISELKYHIIRGDVTQLVNTAY